MSVHPASADTLSAADREAYRAAFAAARAEKWDAAIGFAKAADDPLPRKVIDWMRLKAANSGASFDEIATFLTANPDWPHRGLLRLRAEKAMGPAVPNDTVLAWFQGREPMSAEGAIRLGGALLNTDDKAKAAALIRKAWIELDMDGSQEDLFRKQFSGLIRREDDIARLDRLLWDERVSAARRQMRRVDRDHQRLAEARIALIQMAPGVDGAVTRVPQHLSSDPGLIYERLRWRRRKALDESAVALLEDVPADLAHPRKWWIERRILARNALRDGKPRLAYRLAKNHRQTDGLPLAEGEWLAGWIALRFLDEYDLAFSHFRKLYENVRYPISEARGAYWSGRAAEAAGEHAIAKQWFVIAARHFTTFYGQLAAGHLDAEERPAVQSTEPKPTTEQAKAFEQREMVRLIRILAELDQRDEVDIFIRHLTNYMHSPAEWVLAAGLAKDLGRRELAIYVAKQAVDAGLVLDRHGYPALPLTRFARPDPLLVQAIVRQESAFDPEAVSRAGARGLMQLMPATARKMARQINLPYSRARLTGDPDYNISLGRAYIADLLEQFDGSIILALAAYNAGPTRVSQWLQEYGGPGDSTDDVVDWIESIPFYETRNYVQRVIESLTVYRWHEEGTQPILKLPKAIAYP